MTGLGVLMTEIHVRVTQDLSTDRIHSDGNELPVGTYRSHTVTLFALSTDELQRDEKAGC